MQVEYKWFVRRKFYVAFTLHRRGTTLSPQLLTRYPATSRPHCYTVSLSEDTMPKKSSNPLISVTSGCIAGGVEAICVWPLEFVKVCGSFLPLYAYHCMLCYDSVHGARFFSVPCLHHCIKSPEEGLISMCTSGLCCRGTMMKASGRSSGVSESRRSANRAMLSLFRAVVDAVDTWPSMYPRIPMPLGSSKLPLDAMRCRIISSGVLSDSLAL